MALLLLNKDVFHVLSLLLSPHILFLSISFSSFFIFIPIFTFSIQLSAFSHAFSPLLMRLIVFFFCFYANAFLLSFPLSFSTRQTIHSHTLTHSDTLILAPMTTSSFSCFSLFAFRIQLSLVVISRTRCTFNPSPNPSHCLFWPPRLMVTCPTSHYFPAASAAVLHRRWAAFPSSSIQTLTRFLVSFHFIFFSLRGLSFLFL